VGRSYEFEAMDSGSSSKAKTHLRDEPNERSKYGRSHWETNVFLRIARHVIALKAESSLRMVSEE
jgi:hypothetical protein